MFKDDCWAVVNFYLLRPVCFGAWKVQDAFCIEVHLVVERAPLLVEVQLQPAGPNAERLLTVVRTGGACSLSVEGPGGPGL